MASIRTTLLASAALLSLAIASATHAEEKGVCSSLASASEAQGPGMPLISGLRDQHELRDLLGASLKKDPHGNAELDPSRGHATPCMYLQGMIEWHPKAGFRNTFEDLQKIPDYFGGLSTATDKSGWFLSSRAIQVNGRWLEDLASGFKRQLMQGEVGLYDDQIGEFITLLNCANMGKMLPTQVAELVSQPTPCDQVEYDSDAGDSVFVGVLGTEVLPVHKCTALLEAGDTVARKVLPQDCPEREGNVVCNFDADIAPVTEKMQAEQGTVTVQLQASYKSAITGHNVFYVPSIVANSGAKYEVVVCRRHADGSQLYAVGVRNVHFRKGVAIVPLNAWIPYVPLAQ